MMDGKADINFYNLLVIEKLTDDTAAIKEVAESKIAEWRQKKSTNPANEEYYTVIRDRCSLARAVLLDSNNKRTYDDWLCKSDDAGKSCARLLSRGVYEDAARVADDIVGWRDIDKGWVGAGQWCLAAETYYRVWDEKKFWEAQSAVDTDLHYPAIFELKGDFLLKRVLLDAEKDIPQVIEGKDRASDASQLKDVFEQMCRDLEEAREAYGKMVGVGEVLCKDEYGICLDDVKAVSEGKQGICKTYINFINRFLKVMEDDSDEKDLTLTRVIDLVKVEIPKDLPLGGLLQGEELPSRLAGIEGFYDICLKACNDRLDVKPYRQRLTDARKKTIRAIIRLKILFIIEPIALSFMLFWLILFFVRLIKNDLVQLTGMIFSLAFAALLTTVVSWAYAQLVYMQNSQLERAVCNVALKDKPCDDDGRVRSNIWDNIRVEHRFTSSSISAYIKLGIVFFYFISVAAALLG